ncbi:zinc metalloprotease HtpX [Candidatus Babeliales bacterium]|nr:zinc metalloprotease HtpX [Candidatus Babeliales bacterium]
MFWNQLKTFIFLISLSAILFLIGFLVAGRSGLFFALIISLFINLGAYFFSDKLVLKMYGAKPLDESKYAYIYNMVQELCENANLPMPKLWYIPTSMANAFATGRNPAHASVAVTQGILDILDEGELRGVLAHELSHVKNRDILIATIAATIATTVCYLADIIRWSAIFGSSSRSENKSSGWGAVLASLIMPIAAMSIQLAISRSREYLADESGAKISHDPLALASALEKLQSGVKKQHLKPESYAQNSTASLFIVNPFFGGGLINLFSTHPPMEKRIEKLRKMSNKYY